MVFTLPLSIMPSIKYSLSALESNIVFLSVLINDDLFLYISEPWEFNAFALLLLFSFLQHADLSHFITDVAVTVTYNHSLRLSTQAPNIKLVFISVAYMFPKVAIAMGKETATN